MTADLLGTPSFVVDRAGKREHRRIDDDKHLPRSEDTLGGPDGLFKISELASLFSH
jgi:hypothetical protein